MKLVADILLHTFEVEDNLDISVAYRLLFPS